MKATIVFLILFFSFGNIFAQRKFVGYWQGAIDTGSYSYIEFKKDSTDFDAIDNQLFLICKNEHHGDTLLLYVKYIDCGRLFYEYYPPPKRGSLFAKCYFYKKELRVIYTQKLFRRNISDFGLSTVFYKSKKPY